MKKNIDGIIIKNKSLRHDEQMKRVIRSERVKFRLILMYILVCGEIINTTYGRVKRVKFLFTELGIATLNKSDAAAAATHPGIQRRCRYLFSIAAVLPLPRFMNR